MRLKNASLSTLKLAMTRFVVGVLGAPKKERSMYRKRKTGQSRLQHRPLQTNKRKWREPVVTYSLSSHFQLSTLLTLLHLLLSFTHSLTHFNITPPLTFLFLEFFCFFVLYNHKLFNLL